MQSPQERPFYIVQTKRHHWTNSVLAQQLRARAYQSTVRAQHNFADGLPETQRPAAPLALRDEYTFGFLGLAAEHSEHELEQALLSNVRRLDAVTAGLRG